MKTIKLIDQLRASEKIYTRELEHYDELSDAELPRVLGRASASTMARVLGRASDSTLDRVLGRASASTLDRVNLDIPIIDDIHLRMLEVVDAGTLEMSAWHCGTTHCRAGWAITFAGNAGKRLEKALGSETAARLIYEASTGRPAPDFYASNAEAIADIKRCAALEAKL